MESVRSRRTPRNLGFGLNGMSLPWSFVFGFQLESVDAKEKNVISHLVGFRVSLFSLLQMVTLSMAACMSCAALLRSWSKIHTDRSSMKRAQFSGSLCFIGSMKSKNSQGARTEPCGTPSRSLRELL